MAVGIWQRDDRMNKAAKTEKPRSATRKALSYAFAPKLHGLKEIPQAFSILPRLLANIFSTRGMFPRNHPALRNEALRLGFGEVIGTAHASLQWDRTGLPNVLFFFAVMATLGFSLLVGLVLIMGVLSGNAHAAGSMFTSPSPTTDLGNTWLDNVFGTSNFSVTVPNDPSNLTSTTTQTISNAIPALFRRLAGMYSNAMLVLAVVILLYHLVNMTVMTAHEGKPMGRGAHQVWAPVRLIFALGLLVPISNGFSSGQFLIMWIARQGSGLASYVWGDPTVGIGTTFFNQRGTMKIKVPDLDSHPSIDALVNIGVQLKEGQINNSENKNIFTAPTLPVGTPVVDIFQASTIGTVPGASPNTNALTWAYMNGTLKNKSIVISGRGIDTNPSLVSHNFYPVGTRRNDTCCVAGADVASVGRVEYPAVTDDPNFSSTNPDSAAANAVRRANIAAYQSIEREAIRLGAVQGLAVIRGNNSTGLETPLTGGTYNVKRSLEEIKALYRSTWIASINSIATGAPGLTYNTTTNELEYTQPATAASVNNRLSGNAQIGISGDLGWMSAGAYYLRLALQSSTVAAALSAGPQITVTGSSTLADQITTTQTSFEAERTSTTDGSGGWFDNLNPLNFIKMIFMKIMGVSGLANDQGQWIWQTQFTSSQPLSDMINLGAKLINSAQTNVQFAVLASVLTVLSDSEKIANMVTGLLTKLVPGGGAISKVGGNKLTGAVNKMVTGALSFAGPILGILSAFMSTFGSLISGFFLFLAGIMFLPGIMLFFVLPGIPFLNFLTGIFTWFMSLIQAVVAIPIIAIAHITPNGEGLPSQSARGAYLMILQIFLRPVLMIFGLVAFVMIMNTGLAILNTLFFGVYKFQAVHGGVNGLFLGLGYFGLYTVAAYGVVKMADQVINEIAMRSIQWIGGSGIDHNFDHNSMSGAVLATGAQGQISGALSGLNSGMRGLTKSLTGASKTEAAVTTPAPTSVAPTSTTATPQITTPASATSTQPASVANPLGGAVPNINAPAAPKSTLSNPTGAKGGGAKFKKAGLPETGESYSTASNNTGGGSAANSGFMQGGAPSSSNGALSFILGSANNNAADDTDTSQNNANISADDSGQELTADNNAASTGTPLKLQSRLGATQNNAAVTSIMADMANGNGGQSLQSILGNQTSQGLPDPAAMTDDELDNGALSFKSGGKATTKPTAKKTPTKAAAHNDHDGHNHGKMKTVAAPTTATAVPSGGKVTKVHQGRVVQTTGGGTSNLASGASEKNLRVHHGGVKRANGSGGDYTTKYGRARDITIGGPGQKAPLYTAQDAVVKYVGLQGGYGNVVELYDLQGKPLARHAHLSSTANLKAGQVIKAGTFIGNQGGTGAGGKVTMAVHLHLEASTDYVNKFILANQTGEYVSGGATPTAGASGNGAGNSIIGVESDAKIAEMRAAFLKKSSLDDATDGKTFDAMVAAGKKHNISIRHMVSVALLESSGNAKGSNGKATGSYRGLYQISSDPSAPSTIYEKKYITAGEIENAEKASEAFARDQSDKAKEFKAKFGRDPKDYEAYMMHQQGKAGAFAQIENPDGNAVANIRKFYKSDAMATKVITGNGGKASQTGREFVDVTWNNRYTAAAKAIDASYDPNASSNLANSGGATETVEVEVEVDEQSFDFYGKASEIALFSSALRSKPNDAPKGGAWGTEDTAEDVKRKRDHDGENDNPRGRGAPA